MREIEFRGKRADTGEWVYGSLLTNGKEVVISNYIAIGIGVCGECGSPSDEFYPVDPATVGQYTGLKDKNGKKIFEGDILDGSYINPMTEKKVTRLYRVEFCRGNFYARLIGKSPYGDTMLYFQNERCEIIGNIHDNPSLLEVE